jgi:hypothetical protein
MNQRERHSLLFHNTKHTNTHRLHTQRQQQHEKEQRQDKQHVEGFFNVFNKFWLVHERRITGRLLVGLLIVLLERV